jgi:uncharacterized membrane protein YgcG
MSVALIAFIIWAVIDSRRVRREYEASKKPTTPQAVYNAEQYQNRTQQIIKDAAEKPISRKRVPGVPSPKPIAPKRAVPRTVAAPAPTPAPYRRPDTSPWPFPQSTPAPTPAPSTDLGDVLVGAAIGYAVSEFIDNMANNHDEGRSCSANDSPSFESGGGGDFGGGGASSDY